MRTRPTRAHLARWLPFLAWPRPDRATLRGEVVEEAYDDLVEEAPDWFATHGAVARKALADAVRRLRSVLRPS